MGAWIEYPSAFPKRLAFSGEVLWGRSYVHGVGKGDRTWELIFKISSLGGLSKTFNPKCHHVIITKTKGRF